MIALETHHAIEIAIGIGIWMLTIALIPRILLARRESAATLTWLVVLLALPVVGFVAYWFFGERRLHRTTTRRRLAADAAANVLTESRERRAPFLAVARGDAPDDLSRLATRITGVPPIGGNAIRVFTDPDEATEAMHDAIDRARSTIHFVVYIFKKDESGRAFLERLAEAARRGVRVRLLVDDFGSFFSRRRFFAPLLRAGGEVARFLPVNPLRGLYHANLRNHRKILVADGEIAFTGGLNVGNEYGGWRKRRIRHWRDTHVEVRGPAVGPLLEVFQEDWSFATGKELEPEVLAPALESRGTVRAQVIPSGPDLDWEAIHHTIFTMVTRAEDHVYLTTPYFVPDRGFVVALQTAALRGVDVRVLLPERSDHPVVQAAARWHYRELLRAGVRIFEYRPGMLHSKTVEVDGRWVTIGSANLDLRSFRLNFEVNLAIYGPEVAGELRRTFLADLEQSIELTRDDVRRWSVGRRVGHALARLVEGIL